MKGDDIIAVEKPLESEAWAQLWTLRITHLQSGNALAQRLTPGGTWAFLKTGGPAARVKHLLDKWDHWLGDLWLLPETLLSTGHHHQGAAAGQGRPPQTTAPLLLVPRPPLQLGQPGPHALYTELRCTLPVSDGCHPPSTMPDVFPQPQRGALTEGWGPWAPFPSHSSWPGTLCGHRPCPLTLASVGESRADIHVASLGLGTVTNIRT